MQGAPVLGKAKEAGQGLLQEGDELKCSSNTVGWQAGRQRYRRGMETRELAGRLVS